MSDVVLFQDYIPMFDRVEQNFNAPFPTVNAAIYHMLTLSAGQQLAASTRDDTPGATRYTVRYPNRDMAMVYVLHRNDMLTTVSIHPLVPRNGPRKWQAETIDYFGVLIARCCEEVTRAMRYTHPDFTLHPCDLAPPMPSWSSDPKGAILWKKIYARDMSESEFAKRLGIAPSTLANKKTEWGLTRTSQRRARKK